MIDKEKLLNFISKKWKPHHKKSLEDQFENGMFWALKEIWEDVKVGTFDEKQGTCRWKISESCDTEMEPPLLETQCNQEHVFMEGDTDDNNFKYCPYCGKPIEEVRGE